MLALAGAPFSYRHVDLAQGAQKQPDYLALNRFGQVPAIRTATSRWRSRT